MNGSPIGACTWIWVSPFRDAHASLAAHVRELGFDVLEVCIDELGHVSAEALRAAGEAAGIVYSVCGAFGPDRDLASGEPEPRANALEYLRGCVDLAAAVGAPHVCGPMYSAVGKDRGDVDAERRRSVEGLKAAADYAGERGVRLAIEPLNRYETDLVNTAEQGLELCDDIGSPAVGLLLDTYHLNIEEKSVGEAIRLCGDRLFHLHACENDRGTPSTGHVPWTEVFAALADIGYDRQIVIESFTPAVQAIARAVSLWRPLDASGDALALGGLRFLREAGSLASPA